jgi:hypothetical protein
MSVRRADRRKRKIVELTDLEIFQKSFQKGYKMLGSPDVSRNSLLQKIIGQSYDVVLISYF